MAWYAVRTHTYIHTYFIWSRRLKVWQPLADVDLPWANHSKKFIIHSNGSSDPFEKSHQPSEWLKLSVWKKSSAVRTAWAIRSRKFISCLNGSSYPFLKFISHSNSSGYPFKKETVHVHCKLFWQPFQQDKTRLQNSSPGFIKWHMPSCLHYTNKW